MNKKCVFAVLTAFVISAGTISASAAVSNVSIKTDSKSMSYTYLIDEAKESTKSVKILFDDFKDATADGYISENFTVTSKTEEKRPVYLSLRISIKESGDNEEYSLLDYYDFVIKDEDGKVIYETAEKSSVDLTYKDISLGEFNKDLSEETKELVVEYKINDEAVKYYGSEYADDIDVLLVSSLNNNVAEPTNTPESESGSVTAAPEQTEAVETQTPSTEEPKETEKPKEKKIICGADIEPGRYVVTGNANVKITTADGDIISETTVTDGTAEDVKGVSQFITSIEDGDIITITAISDNVKAVVNFDKTNSGTKSTTAGASTTNKPGSSNTASKNNSTSKTNPKTGDDGYVPVYLVSLMGVSAGAIAMLEVVKRKKVK